MFENPNYSPILFIVTVLGSLVFCGGGILYTLFPQEIEAFYFQYENSFTIVGIVLLFIGFVSFGYVTYLKR
ncbi:hypothetical protein BN2127_JRS8_03563 [Bacillus amyloliquefaciens]|nr:hypothetical protein BN2127_JRS8_03563 [Bacillus amyloliquefaciens]